MTASSDDSTTRIDEICQEIVDAGLSSPTSDDLYFLLNAIQQELDERRGDAREDEG